MLEDVNSYNNKKFFSRLNFIYIYIDFNKVKQDSLVKDHVF